MKRIPRECDRLSVLHLLRHREAALFAGMGLGKTANTLTAFTGLRLLEDAKAMLVVAPFRVAMLTWPNEIAKWDHLRHLRCVSLRRREGYRALERGEGDIYTINYEQLQKFRREYLQHHQRFNFDTVVFDELTAAKSPGSKRINAVRKSLVDSRGVLRRWGLTGTPTPNGLHNLYAQIRLLDGGKRFGPSYSAWHDAHFQQVDYMGYRFEPKPGADAKIHARIADMVLSLEQSKYSDVPAPIEEDINVPLPDKAQDQYHELEKKLLLMLEDGTEIVGVNAAALVQKLIQITGGAVYREDRSVAVIHDAKIQTTKQYLTTVPAPVLIVCAYKHEKDRLIKALPGATTLRKSPDFLAQWNANKIPILIVDPNEMSHGLNMQEGGAHHILWYSQTYSREKYDQLNGRLARSGQKNVVRVTRLICPGTVNDAVVEALRQQGNDQTVFMNTLHNIRMLTL